MEHHGPDGLSFEGRTNGHLSRHGRDLHHGFLTHRFPLLTMELEPIEPQKALELYLTDRETEVTDATLYSHRSRLGHFVRWCEQEDIENLNHLTGRMLQRYRLWRRNEADLAPATEKTQMDTLRVFVRWLEAADAVQPDLHSKVRSPKLTGHDNVRDVMLEAERADAILDYLQTFQYASRQHVVLELLWHTMMRTGGLHAIDLKDFMPEENAVEIKHRPETGTPIKNKTDGERYVALNERICDVIDGWIEHLRPKVTDEHGRNPLIASEEGRLSKSTIRGDIYRMTRPCDIDHECPHGRDIDECEATDYMTASKCPSSVSPHAIRRGSLTNALDNEWPKEELGDRANLSPKVLDMHYNQLSERRKMEKRRKHLNKL